MGLLTILKKVNTTCGFDTEIQLNRSPRRAIRQSVIAFLLTILSFHPLLLMHTLTL